jgi:hypothetical protein
MSSGSDYEFSIGGVKTLAVGLAVTTVVCGLLAIATWGDGNPSPFFELSFGAAVIGTFWALLAAALRRDRGTSVALAANVIGVAFWVAVLIRLVGSAD